MPDGRLATTADEARRWAAELGGAVVVKAQIHAGGRGKGGGIKIARDPEEAYGYARDMIGRNLVTPQTGP